MKNTIASIVSAGILLYATTGFGTTFYSSETKEKVPQKTYEKDTADIPEGKIVSRLLPMLYSGGEHLEYDISWTGGIKLGEAVIDIVEKDKEKQIFELRVRVTTENGALSWVYPVDDLHVTTVAGEDRLPTLHESWQKEGYSYESHKVTKFDQKSGVFRYNNNGGAIHEYKVDGSSHNEFSSFMASRLMSFIEGDPFYVPTWADSQRVKVVVEVGGVTTLEKTIFQNVETREVVPILTFSGTYDQRGDTRVWYTNDECRIPVKVNSKIVIGSLTATLKAWNNPKCRQYTAVKRAD